MPKVKKVKSERCIPYARGFKVPSPQKRRQAVGKDAELPDYNPDPYQGFDFFPPIPAPQSIDDWLAQYAEGGQTFSQFVRETPWLSCRKKKSRKMCFEPLGRTLLQKYPEGKIYLLPIGDFNKEHCVNFEDLIEFAQIYLGIPVKALPKVPLEVEKDGKVKWEECT
ncbi:hypothetical protein FSP39_004719 [Pinctada imbricata]|uniref:Uncharacterized protein n=1 Tax=Pinctada imbricata TaxID=66713 RepID=A0AA89BZW4_PINIB|nr:hypothetical protein FSP39_004719 [Pinctada imbricata]